MIQTAIALALLAAQPAADAPSPLAEVRRVLLAAHPKANVESADGDLRITHNTMTYTVHGSTMTGRVNRKPHQVEGPDQGGFILHIRTVPGHYDGQAVVPQNLRRPYWTTFLNAVPIDGKDAHYHITFSHRGQKKSFLDRVLGALPRARKGS